MNKVLTVIVTPNLGISSRLNECCRHRDVKGMIPLSYFMIVTFTVAAAQKTIPFSKIMFLLFSIFSEAQ